MNPFTKAFLLAAVFAISAMGVGSQVASAASLLTPPGFRLRASNGYLLTVLALGNPRAERANVLVLARSSSASVLYVASAQVTETSIDADLGGLGRISVDFVPFGEERRERSACGGKSVAFESGQYVGAIDFEGEEGYSEAHATSATGEGKFLLSLVCSRTGSEGVGGHSPGAHLTVRHRSRPRFEFEAWKNSPSRPSRFSASIRERRGRLLIERGVAVEGGASTFDFDFPAGRATVAPPAPFSGSAIYRRIHGGKPTWHGNLSVDFPGREGVRVVAPGARASMVRAVLNPSHPFRVR